MGEDDIFPIITVVAQDTIPCVMGGWRVVHMAACAFGETNMVKGDWLPVGNAVAGLTFACVMVGGGLMALAA